MKCALPFNTTRLRSRRGSVLILVACLMLGFFGLLALIVDVGVARTTQTQMNTAADAAALEGLRWRDQVPSDVTDTTNPDQARREEVNYFLQQHLWEGNFGLGPEFTYTPSPVAGAAAIGAGGTLVATTQSIGNEAQVVTYQPALQYNLGDADMSGDMLAGDYNTNPAASHTEDDNFARPDFVAASGGNAFLVRFRRSNDAVQPDVSSTGPTLPLIFGQGAMIATTAPAGDPAAFPLRRAGITVRSVSIASAFPAVHVGLPILAADGSTTLVPGVLPVALRMDFWSDPSFPVAAADGTTTASPPAANDGSGNIKRGSDGVVVAYASDVNAAGESIGDVVVPSGDAGVTDGAVGYLPIVADTFSDAPALHVIGFGFVRINVGADGTLTFSKLTRAGGYVAPLNATSNLAQAWLSLPSADRDAIYQANRQLSNPAADPDLPPDAAPVLCPVLVRSRGD